MGITKVNKNLIGDSALDSDKLADSSVNSDIILDLSFDLMLQVKRLNFLLGLTILDTHQI